MSISIGVLQSAYIWRDSKWVITNIYFKNKKIKICCMWVLYQDHWMIDTTSVWSYCSIPSSSQTSCCKLYTHWTLPHRHTLWVAMVPVWEQHPEKQEGKMDLIIQLHNTYYAIYINKFYRVDRCVTVSQYVLVWVSLAQWYGYWPGVQKTLGVSLD